MIRYPICREVHYDARGDSGSRDAGYSHEMEDEVGWVDKDVRSEMNLLLRISDPYCWTSTAFASDAVVAVGVE